MDSKYNFRVMTALRKRLNLTLEELAKEAGLTYPTVASVENNKTLPSLRTLDAIAEALKISTKELIAMAESPIVQKQKAEKIDFNELVQASEDLKNSKFASFKKAKVFKMELEEGQVGKTDFVQEDCYEVCYVLSGKVELKVQEEYTDLEPDDTAFFDSSLEHTYTQLEDGEFIVVLLPKSESIKVVVPQKKKRR